MAIVKVPWIALLFSLGRSVGVLIVDDKILRFVDWILESFPMMYDTQL